MMADQPRNQMDQHVESKQQTSYNAEINENVIKSKMQAEFYNYKHCAYSVYNCKQYTLDGYEYCLRHILNDKSAPYKQCAFIYNSNSKRCNLPAPKDKKDPGYCTEHALKNNLHNWKKNINSQPPRTTEVLLHSLSHYVKTPRSRTISASTQCSEEDHISEESESLVTKSLDPFVDIDANGVLSSSSQILDMCSDSESDVDATSFGSLWHDIQAESSDNDSIDSEQEDVLKYAKMYSSDEVTLIARDKHIRLQSLYIDQYRYLQHMLREKRRRYLSALKREKDTYCSITNQSHETAKEQRLYKKLKAYNSYHKKHGVEAICSKRLYEKRMKVTEGMTPKSHTYTKCVYTEGGVKCGERALPVTRHCRKHILEDTNQILFRPCNKVRGNMECTTPVEAIFDDTTCRLHMDIPKIRSYSSARKDSESDYDETVEVSSLIKTEIKEETLEELAEEKLFGTTNSVQKEECLSGDNQTQVFKNEIDMVPADTTMCNMTTNNIIEDEIMRQFNSKSPILEDLLTIQANKLKRSNSNVIQENQRVGETLNE